MKHVGMAAIAAALLLAGCGASRLSMSQLQSQASHICTQFSTRTDMIAAPTAPVGGEAFLRRGVVVLRPELRQLRGLRAPDDVADVYSTAVTSFAQKLTALDTTVRDLDDGADPVTAMKALQQRLAPLESDEDGAWRALSIPACVSR